MRTSQFIGRVKVALGLIVLVFALPGCTLTPEKIQPDTQQTHYPVQTGPAVSETPLCGNSPKAINHYSCAKGYSSY